MVLLNKKIFESDLEKNVETTLQKQKMQYFHELTETANQNLPLG